MPRKTTANISQHAPLRTDTQTAAISDDEMESDGPDTIPAKGKIPTKAEELAAQEDEEEDDDDDEPEEFRVEKVLKHAYAETGDLIYQIKWLGYEKKSDLTWEPTENL